MKGYVKHSQHSKFKEQKDVMKIEAAKRQRKGSNNQGNEYDSDDEFDNENEEDEQMTTAKSKYATFSFTLTN